MRLVRPRDLLVTLEPDGAVMIRSTSRGAGARAPAWAVQILAFCSEPRTRAECEQAMGPTGAQAFDGLADAGLLVPAEEQADSPVIFANYAGVDIHRYMLNDEVRLQAYWEGLKAVVKPDDVVIDAGSGGDVDGGSITDPGLQADPGCGCRETSGADGGAGLGALLVLGGVVVVKLGERDVLTETQTGEIDDLLVDVVPRDHRPRA